MMCPSCVRSCVRACVPEVEEETIKIRHVWEIDPQNQHSIYYRIYTLLYTMYKYCLSR